VDSPDCEAILCICETCDEALLYAGISRDWGDNWPGLVWPEGVELDDAVPHIIRDIYSEAALVKQRAPRAFALLIRRALEAVCEDRGTPTGPLAARLKQLAGRGDVPPVLAEMTDVLRVLGNTAAHGPLQAVTVPMTWVIDDFFRAVVEYVYVAPSKLSRVKKKLEKVGELEEEGVS